LATQNIVVSQSLPLERLDKFLHSTFPEVSRGAIQRLLAEGHIRVDGRIVKGAHHPRQGEVIWVEWPQARAAQAVPQDIPLDVLYEDDDLLVLNKPPGLVVHPAAGHYENTLVNALLHHCGGSLSGIGGVARPGIVHRLDKETSGCMVVAKNDAAHVRLAAQFARRQVEKIYHAILCGQLPGESGEIMAQIRRHPTHRKQMAVVSGGGRSAHTSYRVLERLAAATLIEARLHTGRTHQIRVHFKHLGFPVAGDTLYGARQSERLQKLTGLTFSRQLLHAAKLAFHHPATGKAVIFHAPRHADFTLALRGLRA
jgi:23S rRNA pseudouridine1911/1915/1917 synthase